MESALENSAAQSAAPSSTEPLPNLVAQHLAKLQDIATKCDRENKLELIAYTPVTLQEEGNLICAYCWEQDKCKGFEWDFAPNEIFDSTADAQAKLIKVQAEEEQTHANVLSFCAKLKALSEQNSTKFAQDFENYEIDLSIAKFGYGTRVRCPSCKGKGIQKCPACKGTGLIKCPDCNGRGKITKTRTETYTKQTYSKAQHKTLSRDFSRQVKYQVDCDKCQGSGKIKCKICHGDGLVKCRSCSGDGLVEQSILLNLNAELSFDASHLLAEGYDVNELQKLLTFGALSKVLKHAPLNLNGEWQSGQDQYQIPYSKSADLWLLEYRCLGQKFVDILMADGTVVQPASFVDKMFAPYAALLEEAAASEFADVTALIEKLRSSDLLSSCLQAKLKHHADKSYSILKKGTDEHLSDDLRKKIGRMFKDWQAQDELRQEQYERQMRFRRNLKIGAAALLVIAAAGAFAWLKLSGQL